MDFLSKILQRKPPKSGGGSPTAVSTPVKPDHEAHVQFAREFVVELVETVPKKSEKAALAKHPDKEDIVSLKSVSPSEGSFQSVSTVTDNASLPDLLQPESVYKKQTDTDTDTTEYESAAETDPSDTASPISNLIAEDLLASFEEALDKKYPPSEVTNKLSDTSVSQDSDPSPLSDAYEDVSETVVKPVQEVKSLDISGLCYYVSNLCLDSPKSEKDTVNTSSVVKAINVSSYSDHSFTADNNTSEVNDSALSFTVDSEISREVTQNTSAQSLDLTPIKTAQIASTPQTTPVKSTQPITENNFDTVPVIEKSEKTSEAKAFERITEESSSKESCEISELTTREIVQEETSEQKLIVLPSQSSSEVKEISERIPVAESEVKTKETSESKSGEVKTEGTLEPELGEIKTEITSEAKSGEVNTEETSKPKSGEVKTEETSEQKPDEVKTEEKSEPEPGEIKTNETSESKSGEVKTEETLEQEPGEGKTEKTLEQEPGEGKTEESAVHKPVEVSLGKSSETKPVEVEGPEAVKVTSVSTTAEKSVEVKAELKLKEVIPDKTQSNSVEVKAKEEIVDAILEKAPEAKLIQFKDTSKSTAGSSEKTSETKTGVKQTLEPELVELKEEVKCVEVIENSLETRPGGITFVKAPEETCSQSDSEVTSKNSSKGTLKVTAEKTEKLPETNNNKKETVEVSKLKPAEEILGKEADFSSVKVPEFNVHEVTKAPTEGTLTKLSDIKEVTLVSTDETSLKTNVRNEIAEDKSAEVALKEEPEAKTETNKTDSEQKYEVEICNSENIPVEETPSVASVTDSVDDRLLESKDFSTSFEILSIEKEIVSELSEDKKQTGKDNSVTSVELGGGDCRSQCDKQEEKKGQAVLTELFEICDRQQKDLDLSDEKFVDGREFFAAPSSSSNLNETIVVSNSQSELSDSTTDKTDFGDFDESIAEEAEKIYQDILNASSHLISADNIGSTMADIHEENVANPFVTQSALRRSPPPSGKPSPRSSSQGPSPSDSPRARSKLSLVNQVRDNCSPRDGTGEASPRSRSGKNSPDRRVASNRMGSLEGSPKNSINAELNQSEAGPDIAEDAHMQGGDVFKDPSTFDFLNSVGNSNLQTDLRKESLYVKFDPLVGDARTVDQSVPLPPAVEAKSNNTAPAVTSLPQESHPNNTTPPRIDAISVVDKLISLSPSPRRQQQIVTPVKQEEPSNPAMVEELYLLREILAKQDDKHREDILKLQRQIESLQAQLKEYEDRETRLNKKVAEKAQGQKQMSIIMEEYEKTISRLVAEKEQERQAHELDKSSLVKERDTAMGHLGNIEIAFSDLHKKYERSKTVIEGFKKNEEVLRASLAEYEATIRKQEQKYDVLKSHAMAQLENANQELDSVKRSQQAEAAKLKAMLKKAEIKTSSLEEMLEQKVKENQELASICDELINKVGSSQ